MSQRNIAVPPDEACAINEVLDHIGGKWSIAPLTTWAERRRHAIAASRRQYDGQLGDSVSGQDLWDDRQGTDELEQLALGGGVTRLRSRAGRSR